MKKFGKIVGLSLIALTALLLSFVGVMLWIVFTPSRLTPIVRQVADKMLVCEHKIGSVELTFFSTFPEFGLKIDTVCLEYPCPSSVQDTVLFASEAMAIVDVKALLQDRHLKVRKLSLSNAKGYVLIADSMTNLDVLRLPQDTLMDTTATALPFDRITIETLRLQSEQLVLDDRRDSIHASLSNTEVYARMEGIEDVYITISSEDVCAEMAGVVYADHLRVGAELPLSIDMELMSIELNKASVRVNEYTLLCDGIVSMMDSLSMQMQLSADQWQIKPLLALLPEKVTKMVQQVDVDGKLSIEADVAGVLSDSQLPVVDAMIMLEEGKGKYAALPYILRDVAMEVDAHLDLNNSHATSVTVHQLSAKTKYSSFHARGELVDLLTDLQIDMRVGANVYLPDMAYFIPDNLNLAGRAKTEVNIKGSLADLMKVDLGKIKASGSLRLLDLSGSMDSMHIASPDMHIAFELPSTKPYADELKWAYANLDFKGLTFTQAENLIVNMGEGDVELAVSNILDDKSLLHADVLLSSRGDLDVNMDTITAHLVAPNLHAQVVYNTQDTTAIPTANIMLSSADIDARYTDIAVNMLNANIEASMEESEEDHTVPVLMAAIAADGLHAEMDSTLDVSTQMLAVVGITQYNKQADNLLLKWNPQLQVNMLEGNIRTSMIASQIKIPHIDFSYNNREFHIEDSQLQIGNSDFALQGDVRNISDWLSQKGDLEGELNFISNHTDVNELMALFSADSGSEEIESSSVVDSYQTENSSGPFLVPNNMDLVLNTRIQEASVFAEQVRNLKGKLYVQDGVLVLEEMGFICKAAKLQLTAMYRTPRRNHIYVGLDYHMVDVNIEELVNMIPQIDTIIPMLSSFKGKAEFHLAAETYTNADYKIKPSTLRGACSLSGKDLVVMDSETFSMMAKKLMFSKKTENIVDSISAEMTVYKKEIDIYPLCIEMDNYKIALGGRHNLDMTFNYDVNVLSPIYLGINVSGNIDDLKIKLAKCKYAKEFRPVRQGKVEQQSAMLRSIIRESMRKNVRIENDNN